MKVETRFDKGDFVFVIDEDEIKRLKITSVQVEDEEIFYDLLKKQGTQLADRNSYLKKSEENCFFTIADCMSFWKEKLEPTDHKVLNKLMDKQLEAIGTAVIDSAMVRNDNYRYPGLSVYGKKYLVIDKAESNKNKVLYCLKDDNNVSVWIESWFLRDIESVGVDWVTVK